MLTPLPRPTRRRTPSPARTANGWLEGTYAMSELRVGLAESLHQLVHQPAGNTGERADPDSGSVSEGSNPSPSTLCNFSISRLWWGYRGRRCIRGERESRAHASYDAHHPGGSSTMPYFGAAARGRSITSWPKGGGEDPSVASSPTSLKNSSRPVYPKARSRRDAAAISARWVRACGKLPRASPEEPIFSAYNPRWLA